VSEQDPAAGVADRDWPRALALFVATFGLSIVRPLLLVGIPLVLLLLIFPTARLVGLVSAVLIAIAVFGGSPGEGLWFAERGWAILVGGSFVAATLRWPTAGVFARAGAAVAGATAVATLFLVLQPGSWELLDSMVLDRMRSAVATGVEVLRMMGGEAGGPSSAVVTAVNQAVALQAEVFPALVALTSLSALGVAWWLYLRLGHGRSGSLRPVRDFSFNDQLVWLLIAGLALLVLGWGGTWGRAGSNAVVFMGALYALRGVAVLMFVTGGVSLLGGALITLAFLLVAPVMLGLAFFVGVGDTWLALRQRVANLPSGTQ
jgi:hypothetical protein